MIHDETTTEIEIPIKKPVSNIVRIDFTNGGNDRKSTGPVKSPPNVSPLPPPKFEAEPQPSSLVSQTESLEWFKDYDAETPLVLRLVALLLVLLLSLLIL